MVGLGLSGVPEVEYLLNLLALGWSLWGEQGSGQLLELQEKLWFQMERAGLIAICEGTWNVLSQMEEQVKQGWGPEGANEEGGLQWIAEQRLEWQLAQFTLNSVFVMKQTLYMQKCLESELGGVSSERG